MWYFAYGSHLNAASVTEWCRQVGHKVPNLKKPIPSQLENYRLCFPIYSDYWRGGIADIAYDPGKAVYGALFELTEEDLAVLDKKVGRVLDAGKEIGTFKRLDVKVIPSGKTQPLKAVTYQGTRLEKYHIPPSRFYMDLVIQGGYACGLSMMWISYLQSFSTQAGRTPQQLRTGETDIGV